MNTLIATEQNKSAVTDGDHAISLNHIIDWDYAISLNHVMDWDHAKVIDRESNRMDQCPMVAQGSDTHQKRTRQVDELTQGVSPTSFISITTYSSPQ